MRKTSLMLCNLVIFFAISYQASAQNSCDGGSIDSAKYRYEIGQLDECVQGLRHCLLSKNNFTPEQKVQAYYILAKCYLVSDQFSIADSVLTELLSLKENFEPDPDDPEIVKNEVILIKANIISSVSKFSEDIRLAPATVIVITHEEILQRGYTDLIDILKDIPGFDISVYYGQLYANVYQRGFRSNNTDKTLLLFDGVEENDLWSNFADISQQYPLSNIKRVEVVYGPASTMYGPNAFSGVINVITKDPADYLKNKKAFGLNAGAGIGTYNTRYFDLSAAYKKADFSFSITGRMYYSDRPDLSSQAIWDYDPNIVEDTEIFRYKNYRTPDGQQYINDNHLAQRSALYFLMSNDVIRLTPTGIEEAKRLNRVLFCDGMQQSDFSKFENQARSSYINAKLNVGDLTFGFLTWAKSEGNGTTYTDLIASVSGSEWKPAHTTAYMSYNKRINVKLRFSANINYKLHTIRNGSKITTIASYSGFGGLTLKDLVNGVPAHWLTTYYYEQSEQYRSEFKLLYNQSKYFYLISGVELRNSQLQGYYLTDSASAIPQNNGSYPYDDLPGGNHYNVNDIGIYTQGNYRTKKGLGFTAGIRFDHNEIRHGGGLGTQFSPRFVVDYSNRGWIFKAIMSKGVQNVSNYTKFDNVIVVPNPSLTYEAIYNYEISAQKNISKEISADVDFFYSKIDNVVGAVLTGNALKNLNIGEDQVKGIQSNLYYKSANQKWNVVVNYTYTNPRQTRGVDSSDNIDTVNLRIGDIAMHKMNAIVNVTPFKNLNVNFRINYVGSKKAGDSTSVPRNTINSFPGYMIGNITIGFHNLIRGSIIQVGCNNIFNKTYYSPGIRTAGGIRHPNQVLQMGRTFFLKIAYEF